MHEPEFWPEGGVVQMMDLIGVWRFVAGYAVVEGTGERIEFLGPEPRGYGIFEPGGRVMAILTAGKRVSGIAPAELGELFRSMIAYTGKYFVEDDRIVIKVDVAADPAKVGTTQTRYYTFDGQILSLRTAPMEIPSLPEKKAIVYADWEREGW